jgi:hypothetical protein
MASKITVANVRAQVGELLDYSLEKKKRNFLSVPGTMVEMWTDADFGIARPSNSRSASRTMTPKEISVSAGPSGYQ